MLNLTLFKRISLLGIAGAASMLLANSIALAAPPAGTPIGN
jgi:hypothetical protein